jgi:hypothetical protein
MHTYEEVELSGETMLHRSDGAWIPTDPNNGDYAEYLRYTAWVEAGNDPDEFWAQSDTLEA